jgi:fructokinase
MRLVCIGEILWDIFPDAEHLGGAPFNCAVHVRRLGEEVIFLSAVGDDARGREAQRRAAAFGLPLAYIPAVPGQPTGEVRVHFDEAGQPQYEIVRPAAFDAFHIDDALAESLRAFAPDWVAFNTLFAFRPNGRAALERVLEIADNARRFYDVNLRPASYDAALLSALLYEADVVKCNEDETRELSALLDIPHTSLAAFSSALAAAFQLEAVSITRGAGGCAIWHNCQWTETLSQPVEVADTVGAGDAFSAAFLHAYSRNWPDADTGAFANRLGALVASRHGATPDWLPEEIGLYPREDEI